MPRKILFVTGTRADFGKLKRLIEEVEASDAFDAYIFATGMHVLALYGSTINEIHKAGFRNVHPYINQDGSVQSQMDLVLSNTISGIGHYVRELAPDLIVVHGDRVEALAGAICGALNNILVAHIEGGERSGTVDELIRHAVTKLSHLHFVANDEARDRLVQMGEAQESVFITGSPDIDIMLSGRLPSLDEVKEKYEIPFSEYAILAHHPVVSELALTGQHVEAIARAVETSHLNFVAIYPNNDPGSDQILNALYRLQNHPRMRLIPSLRFEYFLTLLKHATVIVGNSSAGVREAPVYGVPTVNIGTRQLNRFRYPSIVNVSENAEEILLALKNLPQSVKPSKHFGQGNSAELFMSHLRGDTLWKTPHQKVFRDLGEDA